MIDSRETLVVSLLSMLYLICMEDEQVYALIVLTCLSKFLKN